MHNYRADSIWDISNTGGQRHEDGNLLADMELQNPSIISPRGKEMAPALQR